MIALMLVPSESELHSLKEVCSPATPCQQRVDATAVSRAPDLGVLPEIADQDHLVHATGHDALLLVARIVRGSLILSLGPRRRFRRRHHAFPQQDEAARAFGRVLCLF